MLSKMLPKKLTGTFGLQSPTDKFWVKLHKGTIQDCAPVLRENYMNCHILYLIKQLEKKHGDKLNLYEV